MKKGTVYLFLLLLLMSFRAFSQQCPSQVTITPSNPAICSGNPVTLSATATGGNGYTYSWNTGETTQTISVNKAGNYVVNVSDSKSACNPISSSIDITSSATPSPPIVIGASICRGTTTTLTASGSGGSFSWYRQPIGGNSFHSEATYKTDTLFVNTTYYVETTIAGCTSARTPVTVNVTADPTVYGTTVCSGDLPAMNASGGQSYQWFDVPTGGTVLGTGSNYKSNKPATANTFYYVEAVVNGCLSNRVAVPVHVTQKPDRPTIADVTICYHTSVTLSATAPGGLYEWFDENNARLIVGPDFTTPTLDVTTRYYVQTNLNGCISQRSLVTVTVNPLPNAPVVSGAEICPQQKVKLIPSGSAGSYVWYNAQGAPISTENIFETPLLNVTTTYYVQSIVSECGSSWTPVIVTVKDAPLNPSVPGIIVCHNSSDAVITIDNPVGTYEWFENPDGETAIPNANSTFNVPPLQLTKTYYVQTTINGCSSGRSPVTITVLPEISAPVVSDMSICSGKKATLTANASGGRIEWYDAAIGGNILITNATYITSALTASTTFYVQHVSGDCRSSRIPVVVTITTPLQTPTVTNANICFGQNGTLSASGTGTIQWFESPNGGTIVHTGNTWEIIGMTEDKTYYVQSFDGGCTSPRVPVKATVSKPLTQDFYYPTQTFCPGATPALPSFINPLGGTFSASPAGLNINSTTGKIDLTTSLQGNYTITFVNNSPCANVSTVVLTITSTPNATFSYQPVYCENDVNANTNIFFPPTASAGTFTINTTGLVFKNRSMNIDLAKSTPGTYTITNTIIGNCGGDERSFTFTIQPLPTVNAGADKTIPSGSIVPLSGTTNAATCSWSVASGSGMFSDASAKNTNYTPASGELSALLVFTANNTAGCISPKDTILISFRPKPSPPIANNMVVCLNTPAILSAVAQGSLQWYNVPTEGSILSTDEIFATPVITEAKSYYVLTMVNGLASDRTEVKVSVYNAEQPPVITNLPVCYGNTGKLKASGTAGTIYKWYTSQTNGNLLSTTDSLITNVLYTNTTFWLQPVTSNGCVGDRIAVPVIVNPPSVVVSSAIGTVCSGMPQAYAIQASVLNTTFLWSRELVPNISNPANSNTSATIDETLINTGNTPVNVIYKITPISNGCEGNPFTYTVMVNPTPIATSAARGVVCNTDASNYSIEFNVQGTIAYWSREAVPGITNETTTLQASRPIREQLINTANEPIDVVYKFYSTAAGCEGTLFSYTVTVNPSIFITSLNYSNICSAEPQNYTITSNVSNATFKWSRPVHTNISNPPADGETSAITESLVNTGTTVVYAKYTITPYLNNCPGTPLDYYAIVLPKAAFAVNSNSPVCISNTIRLVTEDRPGATYLWQGPNGYQSTDVNPVIMNASLAHTGTYTLTITYGGCTSDPLPVQVKVNALPHADAGQDKVNVCISDEFITLSGSVTGGTPTGLWSTEGSGAFSQANKLDSKYIFSEADKVAGSVRLKLISTSSDDCDPSSDFITISFQKIPVVHAGHNLNVCAQDAFVVLTDVSVKFADGGFWTTTGSGTFSPSNTAITGVTYVPSSSDITRGNVKLTLSSTGNGQCNVVQDDITVLFTAPPVISAGEDRTVIRYTNFTLRPTTNNENVSYKWFPNINLSSDTVKNPIATADKEIDYTVTITDVRGCKSTDVVHFEVLEPLKIPNVFTPNGDGINDLWTINELIKYPDVKVSVFTRNGAQVYSSDGYSQPWDGTFNGTILPVGTYYYIVTSILDELSFAGYVAILK